MTVGFEVLISVVMKGSPFWDNAVALWKLTGLSKENVASICRIED
jgi:hypothetical protein